MQNLKQKQYQIKDEIVEIRDKQNEQSKAVLMEIQSLEEEICHYETALNNYQAI